MGRLIDTSVFIRYERGKLSLEELFPATEEFLAISAVTYSELWVGVHRASPARRDERELMVTTALKHVHVLDFDVAVAEVHARLMAALQAAGTKVGDHDLLIAATAIRHDLELMSFDERSFPRVPGLKLVPLPRR